MNPTAVADAREVVDLADVIASASARLGSLVAGGALDGFEQAALPGLVLALSGAVQPLQAAASCAVGRVHASGAALPDGHVSVSRWLQADAGQSKASAGALIARGRALEGDYDATRIAVLAGRISVDHARAITLGVDRAIRALKGGQREVYRAQGEQLLLGHAADHTPDEVAAAAKRLRFILDPDGTDQDALDADAAQRIVLVAVGDSVEIRGHLSKESAAIVAGALDQIVDGWFRRGELPAEDADAEGADADAADPRTRRARRLRAEQLRARALVHLAGTACESGSLGARNGVVPRAAITVDLDTLDTLGGHLHTPVSETPEPIPPSTVRRLLCDAAFTTIVTGGPACDSVDKQGLLRAVSRPVLYVGREQRTVTPRQRAALAVMHPHCAFAGCRVPISRCHVHHVVHWADGGSTDLDNLVPLCHAHHHLVHEGGWRITATGPDPHRADYWTIAPPERRPRP